MGDYTPAQEKAAQIYITKRRLSLKQIKQGKGSVVSDADIRNEFPYDTAEELRNGYFYISKISKAQEDLIIKLTSCSPDEAPHVSAEMDLLHHVFNNGGSSWVHRSEEHIGELAKQAYANVRFRKS